MPYDVPDQHDQRVIVTGANSGTGKEAARRLAGAGAEVILAVRSVDKGEQAAASIRDEAPDARLHVRHLDLADLGSVRRFADEVAQEGVPVDTLINNAGLMWPQKRLLTADGFELQIGTNFFGHFALTNLLLPTLLRAPNPRVVTMSSGAAGASRIDFDDLAGTAKPYSMRTQYSRSKLANLLHGKRLATIAEERHWPLMSVMAHPGYTRTNLQTAAKNITRSASEQLAPIKRTFLPSQGVESGTEPLLFAATAAEVEQGGYYGPRWLFVGPTGRAPLPKGAKQPGVAERLWTEAEHLTGTQLPQVRA